jgi:hypothetical protein
LAQGDAKGAVKTEAEKTTEKYGLEAGLYKVCGLSTTSATIDQSTEAHYAAKGEGFVAMINLRSRNVAVGLHGLVGEGGKLSGCMDMKNALVGWIFISK